MQNMNALCLDFKPLHQFTFSADQCLEHVLRSLNILPYAALIVFGLLICLCGERLDSLWMEMLLKAHCRAPVPTALVPCASGEGSVWSRCQWQAEAAWSRLRVDGRMFLCDILLELLEFCF